MRFTLASVASALLLSSGAAASSVAPRFVEKQCTEPSVVAHTGTAKGSLQTIQNITTYVTRPPVQQLLAALPRKNVAIIYLSDVFGIELLENKLLADSFARAGYLTIAPDMFGGEALSTDLDLPTFNMGAFLAKHTPERQDPIIAKAVAFARSQPGITKVAVAGYCWGGKYAFRFLAAGKGVDSAFSAHPSVLLDDEITAITGPVGVAYAEEDSMLLPARQSQINALLQGTGKLYQTTLYSGTAHGFAVRADISVAAQKFGKEQAFLQAVRWFDYTL